MNVEQKKIALECIRLWGSEDLSDCAGDQMAALLQELIDAPETEPFGYFRSEPFGWTDCAETDDGSIALYTAPPAPSVPLVLPEMSKNHIECIALDAGIEYCGDGVWRASPASMRDFAQRCINDAIPAVPAPAEAPADAANEIRARGEKDQS